MNIYKPRINLQKHGRLLVHLIPSHCKCVYMPACSSFYKALTKDNGGKRTPKTVHVQGILTLIQILPSSHLCLVKVSGLHRL